MPKSPRCLAIMNVHNRRDRLSTLLKLKKNEICQTQLSCLIDIDEMIRCDELISPIVIRTNNPTQIERQIQVDTIKERFSGLFKTRIEKDSIINLINDERILQALIDRDGQRWSELIDQLISEQSNFSLSEIAQQLLNTIERLYTTERLNNLTTGQLQRKIRYAMSQLKHIDEHSYLQNNFKTIKNNRTNINSRKQTECNGTMDMAVTVRQIDKHHNHQSIVSSNHIWKPYVDRLFDQGHSADEIKRLLHKAAETTIQCDDYRLQDVFNYIDTKSKQQRAKTAPSKIGFNAASTKTKPVTSEQFQSTNLFQSMKPNETMDSNNRIMRCSSPSISARKVMSNDFSSAFNNKDQRSTIEGIKNKSISSSVSLNSSLIKSPSIESDIIQIESTENKFITDLNKNEKEQNLPLYSSTDQEHINIMVNSSPTTMNKQRSITNIEKIIQREKYNDKNSDSDDIIIITEQKPYQSQEIIDSTTSQTNETSSFHNLKTDSSTTRIKPINNLIDMPLTKLEEQSIHALQHVQNTLNTIDNTHLHSHSLNIPVEQNKLIDIIFELNLRKPDNIEILMTKCIKLLNNEKSTIVVSQLEEVYFQNLNEEISNTFNLLQEYKKPTMPFIINNEDSSYNRHISNMIMISSNGQTSLKSINENIEQIIESNTNLDLKHQVNILEYSKIASPIRCRPIPYTVSNEMRSTESLRQEFICSTEHISLTTKELNEQLITNKNDLNYRSDIPLKIESELYDDQSQKQWLDSLLSKISDNISRTSNISSTSPSLLIINQTKIDDKDEQESTIMKSVDRQISSLNEHLKSSISIHQHTTNMIETTDDIQNIQYVTDIIIFKKEYATSIIIPNQIFSMIEEQFQIFETKLLQNKVVISSKQILNSNDQLLSLSDEKNSEHINKELSKLNHDFDDTFQKSPSIITVHANYVDEEKQSITSILNDETLSVTGQSSPPSNIDLLEQLDQLQIHEDIVSSKQLVPALVSKSKEKFESSQKLFDNEQEDIGLSKTDVDYVPEINTELLPSNDQKKEEKTKSIVSFPSDNNEDESLISKSHIDTKKPSKSSYVNAQVLDEHTSIIASTVFNHQNEISQFQLPISTQYFKSISNDTPTSNEEKHSPIDSHNQNIVTETSIQNSKDKKLSNEKIDNAIINKFQKSTILSLDHYITRQSIKSVLSPSKTTKMEHIKYKKIATSLQPTSISTTINNISKEDDTMVNRTSIPYFVTEEASKLMTSFTKTATKDDINNDEKSISSMSSGHDLLIDDDTTKKDLRTKLNYNNDLLQNKPNSPLLSNASIQESSLFDDTIRTSSSSPPLSSKENLINKKVDDQQTKTQLTINRTISLPKIVSEEGQRPLISTPHSFLLSTIIDDNIHNEMKQPFENKVQSIHKNTKSSNTSLSTTIDGENQSDKMPTQRTIEEKSSANESIRNIPLENITKSEHPTSRYDKSKEHTNIHSSFQIEQNSQNEDHPLEKIKSLKQESLVKQSSLLSNKQLVMDMDSETKNPLDQIRPSSHSKLVDNNQDRLDDHKFTNTEKYPSSMIVTSDTKRIDRSSPIKTKQRPITSTITSALPSSFANVNMRQQDIKPWISSSENKNDKSILDDALVLTSKEIPRSKPVSSSNLVHQNNRTFDYRHEIENEKLSSQSEKRVTDDNPYHSNSKQQSSMTNTLIRDSIHSSSMPKLLLKRSSIKQNSTILQPTKPNATSSITDVSTSSSNIVATDHLRSTHSITSDDHEEVISLKKTNKKNNSKDEFISKVNSTSKHNMLRKKTPQPSQNQSLTSFNQKQPNIKTSRKKFTNYSLLTNSELAYDTEQGSDVWMNSHEDISQILSINEQDERKPKIHKRQQKKQNKNRIIDGSKFMPFNLKARADHQAYTIDSSRLPSIEQSCGEHYLKKLSNYLSHRPIIRLPVTQIEKFECGTIGPHLHPSSIARQFFFLPSIHNRHHLSSQIYQTNESLTDQFYSFMSSENIDDKQAFESILNWQPQQQHSISKTEQSKFQHVYLLDTSTGNTVRGRQYPILTDEIDMIDDPNTCTIVNKWAFADLVNTERKKFIQESTDSITKSKKRSKLNNNNNNIKICLRKRPLTQFEQNVFKEVDIISIVDSQTILLHIPSITVDNQVFIKNRKFKCDQTFDEHCQISTIYHSTLAPLLDLAIDGSNCLCLIGGGKYSGKNYLLHSLIDLFAFDLIRLLSSYDIYIKLLGICHNRIIDLLQNYSPIRIIKSMNWTLIPNDVFHLKNNDDIDYIACQIKKRRRFIHQLIQINFHDKDQSIIIGSLMIVVLASSQYVYTRNLCSHRRKFLINSLNKTILSFKRALLGIRQNPDRVRAAFNNDILTRLIQPYVFHDQSNICYIGTLNPGHRHRIATKSTIEFARNLRFCLKRINKQRRKRENLSRMNTNNNDNIF
ncbi:unnamed protein product [Rotaria sordida]|uniref:Kinesin motor domain-containing protein n=1 Tax=Rotaria sordida TaxID=392033 RepID=A0A813SH63_9BILA|nr:unnamed protein product [Rotaria sordida]